MKKNNINENMHKLVQDLDTLLKKNPSKEDRQWVSEKLEGLIQQLEARTKDAVASS